MHSIKKLLASLLLLSLPALAEDFKVGPYEVSSTLTERGPLAGYARPDGQSRQVAQFAHSYVLHVKKLVGQEWLLVAYGNGQRCYVRANHERLHKAFTEPCRPDANGDFSERTLHHYFEVVDPDLNGLNGHFPPGPPRKDCCDGLPNQEVGSWPVVAQLKRGTVLYGISNVWVGHAQDKQKRWWMEFRTPEGKEVWVRANRKFIRPIPGPNPTL